MRKTAVRAYNWCRRVEKGGGPISKNQKEWSFKQWLAFHLTKKDVMMQLTDICAEAQAAAPDSFRVKPGQLPTLLREQKYQGVYTRFVQRMKGSKLLIVHGPAFKENEPPRASLILKLKPERPAA